MSRTEQERAHSARLEKQHLDRTAEVFVEIEREVLGCDFGGTSWTDRAEANRIASLLGLAPGVRALEIGAGSGWPGLYLARETGCDLVLSDIPVGGLQIAASRARKERLDDRCHVVAADAVRLPFADTAFDAVYHCDVFC